MMPTSSHGLKYKRASSPPNKEAAKGVNEKRSLSGETLFVDDRGTIAGESLIKSKSSAFDRSLDPAQLPPYLVLGR
jgi:hypothetical protein